MSPNWQSVGVCSRTLLVRDCFQCVSKEGGREMPSVRCNLSQQLTVEVLQLGAI